VKQEIKIGWVCRVGIQRPF